MNEDLKTPTHPILEKTAIEVTKKMLEKGLPIDKIIEFTGLTLKQIKKLKSS